MREQVHALEEDRAFVELSPWRVVQASGSDALTWLNDLLTAELAGLLEGESRRALLLDRTGRVRADIHAARVPDGILLLQDGVQPVSALDLLDPYVLSSDVTLADRSDELTLYATTGSPQEWGAMAFRPSVLGRGVGLAVPRAERGAVRERLGQELVEVGREAAEILRIRGGDARYGVDFGEGTLALEAGLDHLIDRAKGCFVGQESVARVRNLGHPPRTVLRLRSPGSLFPGEPVMDGERQVGSVTGIAPLDDGSHAVLTLVRWDARDRPLATRSGTPLSPR